MHFYSILIATLTLTVSTAFAGSAQSQQTVDDSDCLNICKDDSSSYNCPPGYEKTQLSSGCWTCCDTA